LELSTKIHKAPSVACMREDKEKDRRLESGLWRSHISGCQEYGTEKGRVLFSMLTTTSSSCRQLYLFHLLHTIACVAENEETEESMTVKLLKAHMKLVGRS